MAGEGWRWRGKGGGGGGRVEVAGEGWNCGVGCKCGVEGGLSLCARSAHSDKKLLGNLRAPRIFFGFWPLAFGCRFAVFRSLAKRNENLSEIFKK